MEDLLGWGIRWLPGPPPRQHEHEGRYTTLDAPIHSNKANMKGWFRRQNDIRRSCGPEASWYLPYRWIKTPKKPHTGNLSRPGMEPGPACYRLFTAADNCNIITLITAIIEQWKSNFCVFVFTGMCASALYYLFTLNMESWNCV